jgi:hypothetical protein
LSLPGGRVPREPGSPQEPARPCVRGRAQRSTPVVVFRIPEKAGRNDAPYLGDENPTVTRPQRESLQGLRPYFRMAICREKLFLSKAPLKHSLTGGGFRVRAGCCFRTKENWPDRWQHT